MDRYRTDIDGLRAFAVIPVVLFHAGYSVFSGGFVGVDIFFVISGFLITSIIQREISRNEFSLIRFYERRIRRIYPAALAVAVITIAAAALIVPDGQFKKVGQALIFMNLYSTNILFFHQAGYFSTDSTLNPFLHTWSLSVEEQFYLFFPLFLLLVTRLFKDKVLECLWAATIFSFALCVYFTFTWPDSAFYLIPFRAWELALGALLAIGGTSLKLQRRSAEWLSALGLSFILISIFLFTESTVFPGFAALLPCLGAAFLIQAGSVADNRFNIFMGNPALRYFGLISYSLYLWHWPVFVLARFLFPAGLDIGGQIMQVAIACVLAHLSWRFIEAPFRNKTIFGERRPLFIFFGATTAVTFVIGGIIVFGNGLKMRMPATSLQYEQAAFDNNPDRKTCHGDDGKNMQPEQFCIYGDKGAEPTFALWGDSHGAEITPAIGSLLQRSNQSIKMFTYSQCPPALGFSTSTRHGCVAHNDEVLAYLRQHKEVGTVFLIAHYRVYETDDYHEDFENGFARAITELQAADKKVVVIYPIPGARYSIPLMASALAMRGASIDALTIPLQHYAEINARAIKMLDAQSNVGRLHPEKVLCEKDNCRVAVNDKLLYFDSNHLNMFGANYVAGLLHADIFPVGAASKVGSAQPHLATLSGSIAP